MTDERAVELADQIAEAGFHAAAFKMRALAEQVERLRSAVVMYIGAKGDDAIVAAFVQMQQALSHSAPKTP